MQGGGRAGERFAGSGGAALAGGCLRGCGAERGRRVREQSGDGRGQGGQRRHCGRRGFDGHRDGGQRLARCVAQRLQGHAVGAVIATGHGDGGGRIDHACGTVHVWPASAQRAAHGSQLVGERVGGRHGLHGGEGQPPRHLVFARDDVLDGEGVLETRGLRHAA